MITDANKDPQQELKEIRQLMEQSSRFLSLSGASGIFIGIVTIIVVIIFYLTKQEELISSGFMSSIMMEDSPMSRQLILILFAVGTFLLLVSMGIAIVFTTRKAKMEQKEYWSAPARKTALNLFIPLVAGGIFAMILANYRITGLILPATLIFYGLALVNASKFTLTDIRSLGILEIVLGLLAAMNLEFSLLLWTIGFGVLHIVYGVIMYRRYER